MNIDHRSPTKLSGLTEVVIEKSMGIIMSPQESKPRKLIATPPASSAKVLCACYSHYLLVCIRTHVLQNLHLAVLFSDNIILTLTTRRSVKILGQLSSGSSKEGQKRNML